MNAEANVTRPVSGTPEAIVRVVEIAQQQEGVANVQRTGPNSAVITYAEGTDWRALEDAQAAVVRS